MDEFLALLLVVVVIPWLFVIGRRLKRQQAEQEQRTADLTRRIFALESAVQQLQRSEVASPVPTAAEPISVSVEPEPSPATSAIPESVPAKGSPEAIRQWLSSGSPVKSRRSLCHPTFNTTSTSSA